MMASLIFRILILSAFFSSKIIAPFLPIDQHTGEKQSEQTTSELVPTSRAFFIQNQGQYSAEARFCLPAGGSNLWLAEDHLWITVVESPSGGGTEVAGHTALTDNFRGTAIRLGFKGSNPDPELVPFNPLATRVSFIKGLEPDPRTTNLPAWGGIRYLDLYPGIDLVILASGSALEWYFDVKRGGDPADIQLTLEGVQDISSQGRELNLMTSLGQVNLPLFGLENTFSNPEPAFSETEPVNVGIQPIGDGVFTITSPFTDDLRPLGTVETSEDLVYSTYLGGGGLGDSIWD